MIQIENAKYKEIVQSLFDKGIIDDKGDEILIIS